MIENYGQLKTQTAFWIHRTDLGDYMGQFAQNVTDRINQRFGTSLGPLISDTDTNEWLQNQPSLYLYGMLVEGSAFTHDLMATQGFDSMYKRIEADININSDDDGGPPVIVPYEET